MLGGVLNASLDHHGRGGGIGMDQVRDLLDRPGLAGQAMVRTALDQALHVTFWGIFAIAVTTLLLALLVPRVTIAAARVPGA